MPLEYNTIVNEDCVSFLGKQKQPFIELIFADPLFNSGYKYDVYEDHKAYDDYHAWTHQWMEACAGALKPTGSFWIAIGDEYAAEVRLIGRQVGLHLRNWIVWHYTFGQQTKAKFARSHTHLFYFVRDPKYFTFNDKAVRMFSDRQRVYKDVRANKAGKVPDDTWNEFPRLCGTFGERQGWHPCQMPETPLSRIVSACSNVGDLVFDPFSGSGTTLVVAKKLSREFLGTELSSEYAAGIAERLDGVKPLAELENEHSRWSADHDALLQRVYMVGVVSTESLYASRVLLEGLVQHFNWLLEAAGCKRTDTVEQVWAKLEDLRREARLPRIRVHAVEPSTRNMRPLTAGPGLFQ